jgi:hypothetical protein
LYVMGILGVVRVTYNPVATTREMALLLFYTGLAREMGSTCFSGVLCECVYPAGALSSDCCSGERRARDVCAAAPRRSNAESPALRIPTAEQVRACGALLPLSPPDRERLPTLYLLGPGHALARRSFRLRAPR